MKTVGTLRGEYQMHTKKELEIIKNMANVKINETLHNNKGTDLDYIRDLQTLVKLKDNAEKKLDNKEYV